MRILHIRFKNLNSLVGEWAIDLTHPAFVSDSIFAITGPTGAGKTTLLDAICLAIYGRTPRLNKVTKSNNEIMARQTGECLAEVVFETNAGKFRCHWSQYRAHKKNTGKLQTPRYEISYADSNQIIESMATRVAEKVESITGMDFDRFTRSMLLAQGGFAAFLQANPDERAPILEQITGTEIYSYISVKVHEHRAEQQKKLDNLKSELSGIELLSPEDEEQLNVSLEQKRVQETEVNHKIEKQKEALSWLERIEQLKKELDKIDEQLQKLSVRKAAFQPELEKLEQAKKTLELAGEYASIKGIRSELEKNTLSLKEYNNELAKQEEIIKTAEIAFKSANENYENRRAEQKNLLPVIKQTRVLDLQLAEKDISIKKASEIVLEINKSLNDLKSKNNKDLELLSKNKISLQNLSELMLQNSADESLVEQLAVIKNKFDALQEIDDKHRLKIDELSIVEAENNKALTLLKKNQIKLQKLSEDFTNFQRGFEDKQKELEKLIAQKDISYWHNSLAELKEQIANIEKINKAIALLVKSKEDAQHFNALHHSLGNEKILLEQQIAVETEKIELLEREINLLDTQLSLLKTIQSFEDARHQLQDGQECPLCGSKEHPFAKGNIPVPDKTKEQLNKAKKNFKLVSNLVSNLKVKQAENLKDIEQVCARQKECAYRIEESESSIKLNLPLLNFEASIEELQNIAPLKNNLDILLNSNKERLDQTASIVLAAEKLEKEVAVQRKSIDKMRDTLRKVELETQADKHKKESAEQSVIRVKKESNDLLSQFCKLRADVITSLIPYRVEKLLSDSLDVGIKDRLDEIEKQLGKRRNKWLLWQKTNEELKQQIYSLEIQTEHQTEQLENFEKELQKHSEILNDLQQEREDIANERHKLFNDKNTDDEELRISNNIELAEKTVENSRNYFNGSTLEFNRLNDRINDLKQSMSERATQLQVTEALFADKLGGYGFADEIAYVAACLPDNERKSLTEKADSLSTEQTELDAKRSDKTQLIDSEKQKQITDALPVQIEETLNSLTATYRELSHDIGGIRQKLKDNALLKEKQKEKIKAIEIQRGEWLRWDNLHKLIGSSDGKKYRNFAQGLTFEIMINNANRQLKKMTDRYILTRNSEQPLELCVIDNYQAGEIRSTKNLSGGESFIVSLSLALGLSQMASRNVRVDSLFLDEGFGTLDEDALDTALETLAGLHEDGKLIGVISHVHALKERISTQILITPQTGGRSTISGPGCIKVK